MSKKIDRALLRKKFRGSLLGALSGDCLGSPYESEPSSSGSRLVLQNYFEKLEGPIFKAPVIQYTDDSAMTKSVAETFVDKKDLDFVDLAKRFVKSYYQEPHRGYGSGVVNVFKKLRGTKFTDVFAPARQQFNGQGSYGNGAAMRVAPVALFCYNNYNQLLEIARKQSEITHTHKIGVDGAILQAIAIQQSIHMHPEDSLDAINFVDELVNKMNSIEIDEEGLDLAEAQPYKIQLGFVKSLLLEESDIDTVSKKVIKELGNDLNAVRSVPTALFCFLKALKPIDGINTDNPFRRAVHYAISLGGDTDTIGSMTGAIAGAYYGDEIIPPNILHHCEGSKEFAELADELFEVSTAMEWNSEQEDRTHVKSL